VTDSTDGVPGTTSAGTARHLADLEARYETHLAALRKNAAELQAAAKRDADALTGPAPSGARADESPI
jgi:F0F1-type ATP synthase membrane subunit b/b'